MVRIENWFVCFKDGQDVYEPPEMRRQYLSGNIFGHPRHEDGKHVRTSHIVAWVDDKVTTASGTEYQLGKPCEEYAAWCREQGFANPMEQQLCNSI